MTSAKKRDGITSANKRGGMSTVISRLSEPGKDKD